MVEAADLFNASAFRRTVAGIAKSLGPPRASILPLSGANPEVAVTVAWDLSWYQYRVAFDSAQPVRLEERGVELRELDQKYRSWNARVEDGGRLMPNIERCKCLGCSAAVESGRGRRDPDVQELHRRRVGRCRLRRDVRVDEPGHGRDDRRVPEVRPEDVERAVEAAKAAYEEWRLVPAPKRGELLYRFAQPLIDEKEELAQLMTREMGKVIEEARGDVQEAVDISYYMAGEGRRLFGHTTPSELQDKFNMSVRTPIGVVGVITPWNFPVAIPSWKIVPALVCGDTVVFKPATDTPRLESASSSCSSRPACPPGSSMSSTAAGARSGTRSSGTRTCR